MRPNVQAQIQRTDGERKDRMPMAGETEHPLYHAFVMPVGQFQPLTEGQALVYGEISKALSGLQSTTTVDNGDGTFTHTFQYEVEHADTVPVQPASPVVGEIEHPFELPKIHIGVDIEELRCLRAGFADLCEWRYGKVLRALDDLSAGAIDVGALPPPLAKRE